MNDKEIRYDDAGALDPKVITVSEEDFDQLMAFSKIEVLNFKSYAFVSKLKNSSPQPSLPCELHGVFNYWYTY